MNEQPPDPEKVDEYGSSEGSVWKLALPALLYRRGWRFGLFGIRKRSTRTAFGRPLWDIAMGPDVEKGEMFGHARGIIAIGDIATGWLAIGSIAIGIVSLGGLGIGVLTFGGIAFGLLALGGVAVGGISLGGCALGGLAFGGLAIGYVAVGGGAIGYYALGGGAIGKYVVSAAGQSPEGVEFFKQWFPWLNRLIEQHGP